MMQLVIYIHGKGGSIEEAKHYKSLFPNADVIGFDYQSRTPWEAKKEFPVYYDMHSKGYDSVLLIANSIGAFFALSSLGNRRIAQAFFISPIVDMEELIRNMMTWAKVSEKELSERKEIITDFGETLSWEYLCYVKNNSIDWQIPTYILYGDKDNLISQESITRFSTEIGADLTIMPGGEHWFHTEEQMHFLDAWIEKSRWIK